MPSLEEIKAELEQTKLELARSNKAFEDFAYIVSHDLKAPVRGIDNFTCFLLEDYNDKLDDEGKNQLRRLSALSKRMTDLLNALLMYSRAGTVVLKLCENAIDDIINEQVAQLESFIKDHHAEIIKNNMPKIICDHTAIATVFENLITNALKFNTAEKRVVEISYSEEKDFHQFSIKDNGIGIQESHNEQIFKIFRRLNANDEYEGGMGMGLSVAEKLIERHKGKIWLKSEPNVGTTFYFTISKTLKPSKSE